MDISENKLISSATDAVPKHDESVGILRPPTPYNQVIPDQKRVNKALRFDASVKESKCESDEPLYSQAGYNNKIMSSLRMVDPTKQAKFVKYNRQEIQPQQLAIVIIALGLGLISLIGWAVIEEGPTSEMLCMNCSIFLLPSLPTGIAVALGYKRLWIVEFVPVVLLGGVSLVVALANLNLLDMMNTSRRQQLEYAVFVVYFFWGLFASGTWLPHFILRVTFFAGNTVAIFIIRTRMNDPIDPIAEISALTLIGLIFEFSIYMTYKSKAKLFLLILQGKQQERQLEAVIDVVPDSVFISSKETADQTA